MILLYCILEYFLGVLGNEAEFEFVQNINDGFRIGNVALVDDGLLLYDRGGKVKVRFVLMQFQYFSFQKVLLIFFVIWFLVFGIFVREGRGRKTSFFSDYFYCSCFRVSLWNLEF